MQQCEGFERNMWPLFLQCTEGPETSGKHVRVIYTPLYSKTGVYRGIHFFLIFASKHRLWALVRIASVRRVPTINVLSKNKKKTFKRNHLKTNILTAVKYCCILHVHERVCVMMRTQIGMVLSEP